MTVPPPNWVNRTLMHGDNLDFLRSMNSGTVDLIATDPPFNKNKDFHATPDSLSKGASFQDRWTWDEVEEKWLKEISEEFPNVANVILSSNNSYDTSMGAFLCFMGVRILEMHRILKDTGSMYLHCDPTASHYLKELMDSIFDHENFRSEIIWRRSNAHNKLKKQFGPIHDVILFYTKSDKFTFNPGTTPYTKAYVEKSKFDENGPYKQNNLTGPEIRYGESGKEWRGFNPTKVGRHWAIPKQLKKFLFEDGDSGTLKKLESLYQQNLIFFPKKGKWPFYKHYLGTGVIWQDIWAYQPNTNGVLHNTNDCIDEDVKYLDVEPEKIGYPTQKPIGLYERIIKASSNEGDIVLDPFCGCATTCVAAEKLNRKWVGIDIWDKAHKVVIERLEKEGILSSGGKERTDVLFTKGDITYINAKEEGVLKRTDDGRTAVQRLETQTKSYKIKEKNPHTNKEIKGILLKRDGSFCQGCACPLHERHLELDHKTPRADGGSDRIENRILLCGFCNKLKKHYYTLSWLRMKNKKLGYMCDETNLKKF